MKKDDGGLAFPINSGSPLHAGLTKREWFAGMALASLDRWATDTSEPAAVYCFAIADAMIEESKKGQ